MAEGRIASEAYLSASCPSTDAAPRTPLLSTACRASDKCQRERRKTITGDDLLWAMGHLGFDEYMEVGRSAPSARFHVL